MSPLRYAKLNGNHLQRSLTLEKKLRAIQSCTKKLEVDDNTPLAFYYCMADDLLDKASGLREKKNLIDLYISLVRFSSLLTETIPSHREYRSLLPKQRDTYREKLVIVLKELESLKPEIQLQVIKLRRTYSVDLSLESYWLQDQDIEDIKSKESVYPSTPAMSEYQSESRKLGYDSKVASTDDQVDFKGLGLVKKSYIPYLEDVTQLQPSLAKGLKKRTYTYAGWALTALGRILQFLETTKVADMTEYACESLQSLWDEVKAFKLDLSWLAPHVEFALSMRGYTEKLRRVKKYEEEEIGLKEEIDQVRAKLVELEKNLANVNGDLMKAREELENVEIVNSENELGYGRG